MSRKYEAMFKKCLENRIIHQGKHYKCYLCQIILENFESVLEHLEGMNHKQQLQKDTDEETRNNESKTLAAISEGEQRILVLNGITFDTKPIVFHCHVCKCTICELSNCFEHMESAQHQRLKLQLDEAANEDALETFTISEAQQRQFADNKVRCIDQAFTLFHCSICDCSICGSENISFHVKSVAHIARKLKEKLDRKPRGFEIALRKKLKKQNDAMSIERHFEYKDNAYRCIICNNWMSEERDIYRHIITKLHTENLRDFHCVKCDIYFKMNETSIQCHCLMHLHKEQPRLNSDIVTFKFHENKELHYAKCLLCAIKTPCGQELALHLNSKEHKKKLNTCIYLIKKWNYSDNLSDELDNVHQQDSYSFNCNTDIYIVDDAQDGKNERNGKPLQQLQIRKTELIHSHKENGDEIEGQNNAHMEIMKKPYKCFLCSIACKDITALFTHYEEESVHKKRLQHFYMLSNDQDINWTEEMRFYESIEQSSSTSKKKKIMKRSLDEKRTTGKVNQRLSYGYDILDFGDKYVSMCLETTNENIYKINDNEIRNLQLGISLTFPSDLYRYCIPCNYKIPLDLQYLYEHLRDPVHIDNLNDLEESSKGFEQYPDQFSYLDLARSFMQPDESSQCIECFACNDTLPDFYDEIKIHMNSVNHISKIKSWENDVNSVNKILSTIIREPWYHTDRYHCQICNEMFTGEIKFAKHLKLSEHAEKVKLNSETNNQINICYACSTCWYGSCDYSKHLSDSSHKLFILHSTMHPKMYSKVSKLLKNANMNVTNFIRESDKSLEVQQYKVKQVLEAIEKSARPLYPQAKAYAFGSRSSNLGLLASDVDIFLDCENIYSDVGSSEQSITYIKALQRRVLFANKNTWVKKCSVLHSRVPILKLEHKATGFKCDLSFLNGLGVEKSKLIRNYVVAYPHCRELILFLKQWFNHCQLYGPQAINAYAISWYAIFYLQIRGILPSVSELIKLKNKAKIVDGWQCGFLEEIPVTAVNVSFKDLLQGFFLYYAKFDYRTEVACPLLGQVVKKRIFIKINDLPKEMETYKIRIRTVETEPFSYDSPMAIQDPIDLSQNITKATRKMQLRCFRLYCSESSKI